jgi:WD40 repeat protein/serine/threonine protein kinase
MSTNTSSADYGRFEELAEEFAARFRRGERPSLQEYIDRCPDLAEEIRELFPALVEVERVKEDQPARPGAAEAETAVALPPLGQVGDYRILREVGRGGMGVVYEAEQVSLGRRVALKVLPRQVSQDLKMLARFRREARSAAQLHHTNIVPVFEVGKAGEVSYYAMQFIQGQGLDAVIDELQRLKGRAHRTGPAREPEPPDPAIPSGPTASAPSPSRPVGRMAHSLLTGRFVPETPGSQEEVEAASAARETTDALSDRRDPDGIDAPPASDSSPVATSSLPSSVVLPGGSQLSAVESGRQPFFRSLAHIGRQVAAGLSYAHARGIVHRDIKPSNLLLDTEGVVWITDFGLAKASDDRLTQTGDILGTVRYMAPERFRGEGDGRADVYALGLTLYELLTLRPAFDSPDRLKLIEQIKAEDPPRPRTLDTHIPRDLETIVLKAIAKDPQGRYPSADALGEDLRRFLADEPIRARRVGPLERAWIWARRRPAAAALLLVSAVAALALVGAGVAFAYNSRLEAALDEAEFQRYFHHIARAVGDWREGNMVQVEKLLDECPPERRSWEWYYLKRLCHTDLLTLRSRGDPFHGVAYSPDGTRLAASSSDGTVRVWDASTCREVLPPLRAHSGAVGAVAYSPDGKKLAAVMDKTVKFWDVSTGQLISQLEGDKSNYGPVAFSPDGRRLVAGDGEGVVRVWDVTSGREVPFSPLRVCPSPISSVAYSPDGRSFASADYEAFVRVWDATTGKRVPNLSARDATGAAMAVAFSPDGRRLASGSLEGIIKVWDLATGQAVRTFTGHPSGVCSVAFSPDGRLLASARMDGTIELWALRPTSAQEQSSLAPIRRGRPAKAWTLDPTTAQAALTLKGHAGSVLQVAFSPDGMQLASASVDGTIKIWDAQSEPEARTLAGHTGRFSPDGKWLASASYETTFTVWDTTTGQEIQRFPASTWGLAFSPDGKSIASSAEKDSARLWDVASGRPLRTFKEGQTNGTFGLAFSRDGKWIASGGSDGTLKLWDVATGKTRHTLRHHGHTIIDVGFSPDSTRVASGSNDGTVLLWDVTTGQLIHSFPGTHFPSCLAFSPDGTRIATAADDRTITLWDVRTGQRIDRAFEGNAAPISYLAFSPDGRRLASGGKDGMVKLWDVESRQEALVLRGHASWGVSLDFTRDGTRLATADLDGTLKFWDARPWTPEVVIEREAVGLLDSLFAKPLRKADVLDYLRNAPTIRPRARQLALSLVAGYHEETNPEIYHQESWALVRQPYLNAIQYRFALLQAEHACSLAPDRQEYRLGLGAALYRAGRYREALETLGKAHRPDTGSPATLAFLATAHHQLGQHERARAALARLRQLLDQPRWAKDAEARDLVHEAETLIARPVATTER